MNDVLIFDYDGVIVDSLAIFMKSFFEACEIYGYNNISSKAEFLQLFNGNMFAQMRKRGMSENTILGIVNHLKQELIKKQEQINLFPGIKCVLKELSKNFSLLISTSNETSVVRNYLRLHEIEDIFDDIYGSDIEPSKVKKIKLIQNKTAAEKFTYIGDTIGDIKEAKQAHITSIAVTWGWHSREVLKKSNPDFLVQKPKDLISLLMPNYANLNDI